MRASRSRLAAAAGAVAFALTLAAAPASASASKSSAKRDLERLEHQRTEALRTGTGDADLFAADAIRMNRDGRVSPVDKAGSVAAPQLAAPLPDYTLHSLGLRVYGNSALTTGSNGGVRFVRIWRRTNGHWLIVAHQATPITAGRQSLRAAGTASHRTKRPTLRAVERDVWQMLRQVEQAVRLGDLRTWRRRTADEFIGTSSNGAITTKADPAVALRADAAISMANISDVRVKIYDQVAVATWADQRPPAQRVMVVAVKERLGWRRAAVIATRIASNRAAPAPKRP